MRKTLLIFFIIISFQAFASSTASWKDEEVKARSLLNQGKVEDAIIVFREIILSSDNNEIKRDSYYWISIAYINSGKHDLAENNLEHYIRTYGRKGLYYEDALYQRGVNFFLLEKYTDSIKLLDIFLQDFPRHRMFANANYWIGECLYALGKFDDAQIYFTIVTEKYPGTVKYEASLFKLRLIEHKKTELVLQNLIKWSHEQYLSSIQQFKNSEQTLLQMIEDLKKNGLSNPEAENRLREENDRLRKLVKEFESSGTLGDDDLNEKLKQLDLKLMFLDRKEKTLRLIESQLRLEKEK